MSKHLCSKELYQKFLMVTSQRYSALSLSDVSPLKLSHDSISSWLSKTKTQPKDIWNKAKDRVLGTEGILIVDETVLNKSRSNKIGLVKWMYSGTEHGIVKGIGLLNFVWNTYTEGEDISSNEYCPIDFRIYDPPEDNKTKNDQFREMLSLAKKRGIEPECIVADSWFGSLKNLKCIRDHGWSWVIGLRKNRVVNRGDNLENLEIPDNGLKVHLRGYGWIYVFKFESKNGRIDYIGTNLPNPTNDKVKQYVKRRWSIEVFHRELKQTCGLEKCQARAGRSQRNHIALSILCWLALNERRLLNNISFYQQQWDVVKVSISQQLKIELAKT